MPLPLPNLDDRTFQQLVDEATQRIKQSSAEWDDLSPSDPGVVLLEVFAYLTETMIYRLNRLPQKAYIAFLRLLGVSLHPPAAAAVTLRFSRAREGKTAIDIPAGTRVTLGRAGESEPPVFTTVRASAIPENLNEIDVLAYHCDLVQAEAAGTGTGLPGLTIALQRPPVVEKTGDDLDLVVGIEAGPGEFDEQVKAIQYDGKTYRIWREVENFTNLGDDPFVYVADRMLGTISFAPAILAEAADGKLEETPSALAAIPVAGRDIRVWYWRGGGPTGNVAANTLTGLKDPLQGVKVTNPTPATGGRSAETLDNALERGPKELHSLQRAVTAEDFELVALKTPGVVRAKAFTRAALWSYATRGAVELLLVPDVPEQQWPGGKLTSAALQEQETERAKATVQTALDERRPLGTTCVANWARYKSVRVTVNIVVRREENPDAVKQRILERLYRSISPLPSPNVKGWPFGQALRVSHVYDIALSEPGVRWVDDVSLQVEEVPLAVASIAADGFQARTWYAASGDTLFRSLNDGGGWEPTGRFPDGEQVEMVSADPHQAGLVAVSTRAASGDGSRVYVSRDCGETWERMTATDFHIESLTWSLRDKAPMLLLATDAGLYELTDLRADTTIVQVLVDPKNQAMSFYAVTAAVDAQGRVNVAAAAQNSGGVFLSVDGGKTRTFRRVLGLENQDVRVLTVQADGARLWLWAGTFAASGEDIGSGCFRWELLGEEDPVGGWQQFNANWKAGSCRSLAFLGPIVMAATHRGGVIRLDPAGNAGWQSPDINSGLPLRDLAKGRFVTIDTVASDPQAQIVMAGVMTGDDRGEKKGVYLAAAQDKSYDQWQYDLASNAQFTDKVTLPDTWLFVSGEHNITVVREGQRPQA